MSNINTLNTGDAWHPDVQGFAPETAIPDALVNVIATRYGSVEGDDVYCRVPLVLDDEAALVPEGQPIPQATPTLSEALVLTVKVAHLLQLSREQFTQPNAAEILSRAAGRAIITKADDVMLNQLAPTAPAVTPPAGILAQGILNAGAVDANLDVLVDALATIGASGGVPSHVVLSPSAWGSLRKLKTATGANVGLLGTGTNDAAPYLLSVPVLVNKAVPAGSGLIVDRTDLAAVVGPVNVAQSEHVFFNADSIALRVTLRFGCTVLHPNRHATFTIA